MTMTGYVLNYFPGLVLLVALVLGQVKKRLTFLLLLASIVTVNVAAFLATPRWTARLLLGLPLTSRELRDHDYNLAGLFARIRRDFDPKDIVIVHGCQHFYWGFRQFQYHLPEYRNLLLVHDSSLPGGAARKSWQGENYRTTLVDDSILQSNTALLVVPPGENLEMFRPFFDLRRAAAISGADGRIYELAIDGLTKGAQNRR